MNDKTPGAKGQRLEEILRAYFLQAGFFVVRGASFQIDGEDLTDLDLWLYERPTGTARRRQVVDAKSKSKPKAVERLLWTKGLAEALDMDGAYVATTDSRPSLRRMAKKLGVSLLDGTDIQRIRSSEKVHLPERLTDEELNQIVRSVDKSRKNKEFQICLFEAKSSVVEGFGVRGTVRALDSLSYFAKATTSAHPGSEPATVAGRLTYFCAALVGTNLDYVSVEAPFRSIDERREMLVNAIRYGNTDKGEGLEKLRLAAGIIRQYADNGAAIAKTVEQGFSRDLNSIPAEIIADHVVRMGKNESLFSVSRELERASYLRKCPNFDQLDIASKSFLGALFDFSSVDRAKFAEAWKPVDLMEATTAEPVSVDAGPLFKKPS